MSVHDLLDDRRGDAVMDAAATREIRRAILTAIAVPGYQVPFGSREMPVARGWGSGGLQVTLAIAGPDDVVKVIDQGDDEGVNAVNLRRLIMRATGADETSDPAEATLIQTRHRIPEDAVRNDQILILQVPVPEPLRGVERDMRELARMHAEADYSRLWVSLYEDKVRNGVITQTTGYPCMVAGRDGGRFVIATTPIPRWDIPRLDRAPFLSLFGAGREKRIYAVPPDTEVIPLTFDDVPFEVERTPGASCDRCGASEAYLVAVPVETPVPSDGDRGALRVATRERWVCSDSDWCRRNRGRGVV